MLITRDSWQPRSQFAGGALSEGERFLNTRQLSYSWSRRLLIIEDREIFPELLDTLPVGHECTTSLWNLEGVMVFHRDRLGDMEHC